MINITNYDKKRQNLVNSQIADSVLHNTTSSNDIKHSLDNISTKSPEHNELRDFIDLIFSNNTVYSRNHGYSYFQSFANKQSPRATILLCSDSRVQTAVFDGNKSVNEFFIIRNIGNQIETAKGSIEFGVRNIGTPILIIIGHSGCGAIKAALEDFSQLSPSIQKELKSLKLQKKHIIPAIKSNVHQQVEEALKMFNDLIQEKKLIVMGLLYDFRDDFKRGYGSLILVNLNGEKKPEKIKNSPYLKNINNISIGIGD